MALPGAALGRAEHRRHRGQRGRRTRRSGESAAALVLVAPALVVFGLFQLLPLGMTGYYSLTDRSGFGEAELVGLDNFAAIAADDLFWRSLANTGVYALATVPLSVAAGLALALLLDAAMPARALLRAVFYVPVVVSAAATGLVARWMFDERDGVVNRLLTGVGLPAPGWQTDAGAAMASVVVVSTWSNLGLVMVVYLAGLQGVPRELHQAAALDGAGRWRTTRSITWPLLAPTTALLVVYLVITSFQVFDLVVVMTGGGPDDATTLLVGHAYAQGFQQRRQGYAAALGVVLYAIVLAPTLVTALAVLAARRRGRA